MDTDHPRWAAYEARFMAVADLAEPLRPPAPPLDRCQLYLCLFGENGLTPDEEFAFLDRLDDAVGCGLQKVVIETSYWEETVLFVR